MSRILFVDATPMWRSRVAEVLHERGYTIVTADDGIEALAVLRNSGADLVMLDVDIPRLTGFGFLEQLRRENQWANLPVIMLTAKLSKEDVLLAKRLGASDYLLKNGIDISQLVERVQKRLPPPLKAAAPAAETASESSSAAFTSDVSPALTRQQSIDRAERITLGKTLPGVVRQITSQAPDEQRDLSSMTHLIGQDPVMTIDVLEAASNVAEDASRGKISRLDEAVRILGNAAIRDIAASMRILEVPALTESGVTEPGVFNLVAHWRHLLAVASLCRILAPEDQGDLAYIVGLCHSIGDFLFRITFDAEYRRIVALSKLSGLPLRDAEQKILGITRHELVEKILQRIELPPAVRRSIIAYHRSSRPGVSVHDTLARVVMLADVYARAIMLDAGGDAGLQPTTTTDFRVITGREEIDLDTEQFRADILAATAMCAGLTPAQSVVLGKPFQKRRPLRICLTRDIGLASFDPIACALAGLAQITIRSTLPTPSELSEYRALIVVARSASASGLSADNIAAAVGTSLLAPKPAFPILWLVGRKSESLSLPLDIPEPIVWPVSLQVLSGFIEKL